MLIQEQDMSSPSSSYAVIKQKGRSDSVRMQLPLRVGTSPHADIIVNSQALLPCSYVVEGHGTAMNIVAQKDGSSISPSEMSRFGLKIKGPFPGIVASKLSFMQRASEFVVLENIWFAQLPETVKKVLGGRFPQKARLGAWASAAVCTLALAMWAFGRQAVTEDFSNVPYALSVGVINKALFGASPTRVGNEKGILFHLAGLVDGHVLADEALAPNFHSRGGRAGLELVVLRWEADARERRDRGVQVSVQADTA